MEDRVIWQRPAHVLVVLVVAVGRVAVVEVVATLTCRSDPCFTGTLSGGSGGGGHFSDGTVFGGENGHNLICDFDIDAQV